MTDVTSKGIYLSYSEDDKSIAHKLSAMITELLGDNVWLRDFDLDGGSLVIDTIDAVIADAKFFILFLSKSALKSSWIMTEASVATFKAIESQDFRMIVVRLDNTELPSHLKTAINSLYVVNLSKSIDDDSAFLDLIEYIEKTDNTFSRDVVYVDRGSDADKFSLTARRNRVIFILGWAGIGKTSFVIKSITEKLHKHPITIRLTRGHSLDLLARQILQGTHVRQPMDINKITDQQLKLTALDAIKQRSDKFFIFIDNAEEGLDASNQLLSYYDDFLGDFIKENINTHIVLATTRRPDYSPKIATASDILPLDKLDSIYIQESIDLWLHGAIKDTRLISDSDLADLVELAGGYPLAAKMIATYLKVKSPGQILMPKQVRRFQLQLAEYILRSVDQAILTDLHRLILQALSAVREPMLVEDLLSIQEFKKYRIEEIQQARWELTDWFLIQQTGEMMSLHNFLDAYYHDILRKQESLYLSIASGFGLYAYNKTMALNDKLTEIYYEKEDNERAEKLSNEIFRYAIPAERLLRSIGKNEEADKLPLQFKGTLRDMVFYFYQDKRDYKSALSYAEKWLRLYPGDLEIMLFQVRCYRNLRDKLSLQKAEKTITDVERQDHKKRFAARLYREKAFIAEYREEREKAKAFFREGISIYSPYPYPENHVGLAQLLLREIDELPPYDYDKKEDLANEALELIEIARSNTATFDRFHLGTYVEALIQSDKEDQAFPLLEEALQDRPDDERLNYRMAEILRKRNEFDQAESYARIAVRLGHPKALLTLANIIYEQSADLMSKRHTIQARERFRKALDIILGFQPSSSHEKEVADGIASKIYRALGVWDKSKELVYAYNETRNPYTIYEQCQIDMWESQQAEVSTQYINALEKIKIVVKRIKSYEVNHQLSPVLQSVLEEAQLREEQLQKVVSSI
jgi:tetratricopeptide (TPR) repeat protein